MLLNFSIKNLIQMMPYSRSIFGKKKNPFSVFSLDTMMTIIITASNSILLKNHKFS
jgi:hypothetical protein